MVHYLSFASIRLHRYKTTQTTSKGNTTVTKKGTIRNVSTAAWVQTIRCDVMDFESHAEKKNMPKCRRVFVYVWYFVI